MFPLVFVKIPIAMLGASTFFVDKKLMFQASFCQDYYSNFGCINFFGGAFFKRLFNLGAHQTLGVFFFMTFVKNLGVNNPPYFWKGEYLNFRLGSQAAA